MGFEKRQFAIRQWEPVSSNTTALQDHATRFSSQAYNSYPASTRIFASEGPLPASLLRADIRLGDTYQFPNFDETIGQLSGEGMEIMEEVMGNPLFHYEMALLGDQLQSTPTPRAFLKYLRGTELYGRALSSKQIENQMAQHAADYKKLEQTIFNTVAQFAAEQYLQDYLPPSMHLVPHSATHAIFDSPEMDTYPQSLHPDFLIVLSRDQSSVIVEAGQVRTQRTERLRHKEAQKPLQIPEELQYYLFNNPNKSVEWEDFVHDTILSSLPKNVDPDINVSKQLVRSLVIPTEEKSDHRLDARSIRIRPLPFFRAELSALGQAMLRDSRTPPEKMPEI